MKKKGLLSIVAAAMLMVGCGGIGTGGLLGGIDGAGALGNVIVSVLGINKVSEAGLVGNWNYVSFEATIEACKEILDCIF